MNKIAEHISNWDVSDNTILKDCNSCNKNLADTTENFYVRSGLDTLYAVCKKCIAKSGNKKRQLKLVVTE